MPGGPGAGGRSIFNIGKVFPQGAKDVKSKVLGGRLFRRNFRRSVVFVFFGSVVLGG